MGLCNEFSLHKPMGLCVYFVHKPMGLITSKYVTKKVDFDSFILYFFWWKNKYRERSDIVPGHKCEFQKVCWSVSRLL
jgi:hypothetical protein